MFHYVYPVLHHPQYRERYAANLRRELPRITFVRWGQCPDAPGAGGAQPLSFLFLSCSGYAPGRPYGPRTLGIPLWWRLIDCSFGVFGIIPLWFCRKWSEELESRLEVS